MVSARVSKDLKEDYSRPLEKQDEKTYVQAKGTLSRFEPKERSERVGVEGWLTRNPTKWWRSAKRDVAHPTANVV